LIVVGNPFVLSQDPHWNLLLKYCIEKGAYTGLTYRPDQDDNARLDTLLTSLSKLLTADEAAAAASGGISHVAAQEDPAWTNKI
jgi:hypothetical protein